MYLKALYLRNFRNYEEAEVHFSPSINAIYGENAQGKTNLLEAIALLSTGRSFRTQHFSELIRQGETFFTLEAEIVREGVTQTVQITCDGTNRRLKLNATTYSQFHPLLGMLPSILHAPMDAELISGSPATRRRFLNLHLAQSDPLYVHHLTRYWRAMKQRNCLLKAKSSDAIDCWEAEMAVAAAYLSQKRSELIHELEQPLKRLSKHLSQDREEHTLHFHPSHPPETFLQQLQKSRSKEKELGFTLVGPHRDDLSFWIDGKEGRFFASEGQKKTAAAALRLAEWDRLAAELSSKPLMAIDDLGLPLDEVRQKLFRNSLAQLGQVFITMPALQTEFQGYHCVHITSGSASF